MDIFRNSLAIDIFRPRAGRIRKNNRTGSHTVNGQAHLPLMGGVLPRSLLPLVRLGGFNWDVVSDCTF
jgi:hypothetical protein